MEKEEPEDYFTLQPLPDYIDTSKWKEEFIITNEQWELIKKSMNKGDQNETLA